MEDPNSIDKLCKPFFGWDWPMKETERKKWESFVGFANDRYRSCSQDFSDFREHIIDYFPPGKPKDFETKDILELYNALHIPSVEIDTKAEAKISTLVGNAAAANPYLEPGTAPVSPYGQPTLQWPSPHKFYLILSTAEKMSQPIAWQCLLPAGTAPDVLFTGRAASMELMVSAFKDKFPDLPNVVVGGPNPSYRVHDLDSTNQPQGIQEVSDLQYSLESARIAGRPLRLQISSVSSGYGEFGHSSVMNRLSVGLQESVITPAAVTPVPSAGPFISAPTLKRPPSRSTLEESRGSKRLRVNTSGVQGCGSSKSTVRNSSFTKPAKHSIPGTVIPSFPEIARAAVLAESRFADDKSGPTLDIASCPLIRKVEHVQYLSSEGGTDCEEPEDDAFHRPYMDVHNLQLMISLFSLDGEPSSYVSSSRCKIAWMNARFQPFIHQLAYVAMTLYLHAHSRFGMNTDVMGMGKTAEAFLLHMTMVRMHISKLQVLHDHENAGKPGVSLHLPAPSKPYSGKPTRHHGSVKEHCPSQKPNEIMCYCVQGGLTQVLADSLNPGPAMYITRLNLVPQVAADFSMYLDDKAWERATRVGKKPGASLEIVIAHGNTRTHLISTEIRSAFLAAKYNMRSFGVRYGNERIHMSRWEVNQRLWSCFVISTPDSWVKYVFRYLMGGCMDQITSKSKLTNYHLSVAFGTLFIDEFHTLGNQSRFWSELQRMMLCQAMRMSANDSWERSKQEKTDWQDQKEVHGEIFSLHDNRPVDEVFGDMPLWPRSFSFVICMSGTPAARGVFDAFSPVRAMSSPLWLQQTQHLCYEPLWRNGPSSLLATAFDQGLKTYQYRRQEKVPGDLVRLTKAISGAFVIGRRATSGGFDGKALLEMPKAKVCYALVQGSLAGFDSLTSEKLRLMTTAGIKELVNTASQAGNKGSNGKTNSSNKGVARGLDNDESKQFSTSGLTRLFSSVPGLLHIWSDSILEAKRPQRLALATTQRFQDARRQRDHELWNIGPATRETFINEWRNKPRPYRQEDMKDLNIYDWRKATSWCTNDLFTLFGYIKKWCPKLKTMDWMLESKWNNRAQGKEDIEPIAFFSDMPVMAVASEINAVLWLLKKHVMPDLDLNEPNMKRVAGVLAKRYEDPEVMRCTNQVFMVDGSRGKERIIPFSTQQASGDDSIVPIIMCITTETGSTGFNLPLVKELVLMEPNTRPGIVFQIRGRNSRTNTSFKETCVIILQDDTREETTNALANGTDAAARGVLDARYQANARIQKKALGLRKHPLIEISD